MSDTFASPRVAILLAEFNAPLMAAMLAAATQELQLAKGVLADVVKVPGCYEVPLIADLLLASAKIDLLVVLGYIERGETLHGEVMGHVVHNALVQSQIKSGKPVGIGIIGPGATPEQAELRKDAYARAAVRAGLQSFKIVRTMK